jgi:hypothetical protein
MRKQNILKLSQSTIEKLDYYVYLLFDLIKNEVFYVGKGKDNRINKHFLEALDKEAKKSDKVKTIRKLGSNVNKIILRHGLTENEAFAVEAAMIDYIGLDKLANSVKGHVDSKGMMDLEDVKLKYEAEEAVFNDSVLLININRQFKKGMSDKDLYEATRKHWKVNFERVKNIKIICAVSQGIIREVFEQSQWLKSESKKEISRCYFIGRKAKENIRNKYIHKSVISFWPMGSQNPIKYSK